MDLATFLVLLRAHRLAVLATVASNGAPQAAVVGYAVTDSIEIVFDTLTTTRKYVNLLADPRTALVIGGDDDQCAQIEGLADVPAGADLARLQAVYFAVYPEGRERMAWPDITWVRVQPTWVRLSDYRVPVVIWEHRF